MIISYVTKEKKCAFDFIYFAKPTAGIVSCENIRNSRFKCGVLLAHMYKYNADIVSGVPDSGLIYADGYSQTSGTKLSRVILKDRDVRYFEQPTEAERHAALSSKYKYIPENIEGKRIVLIDDSIIRGLTTREVIAKLREHGAKEVHMLSASPRVLNLCNNLKTDCITELVLHDRTQKEARDFIGADTLEYMPREVFELINHDDSMCLSCFSGGGREA